MKLLRFVMFLFYRYYSTGGTYRIPYFSALSATGFLIFLHIFEILIIINKVNWLPMKETDNKVVEYGKVALCLLPIFILIAFLVKEKNLKQLEYDEDKIKRGGRNLIVYVILSILLFIVVLVSFA